MVAPSDVLEAVSHFTGVPISEITDKLMCRDRLRARSLAAASLRRCSAASFPEIARALGCGTHSSMMRLIRMSDADSDTLDLIATRARRRQMWRTGERRDVWPQPPVPAMWLVASDRVFARRRGGTA